MHLSGVRLVFTGLLASGLSLRKPPRPPHSPFKDNWSSKETMPYLESALYRPPDTLCVDLKQHQLPYTNYPDLLNANNAPFLTLPGYIDSRCDPHALIKLFNNDAFMKQLTESASLFRNEKQALELNINYIILQNLLTDFYQHTPIGAIKDLLYFSQKLSFVSHKDPLDITIKFLVKKHYDSFLFAPAFHQHDSPLRYYAVIQLSEHNDAGTLFNNPQNKFILDTKTDGVSRVYRPDYKNYQSAYWTQAPIGDVYLVDYRVPHMSAVGTNCPVVNILTNLE